MAKLEGSMAKGYIFDEALGLCIEYKQCFRAMRCCVWDSNKKKGVIREILERQPKPHTLQVILHIHMCVQTTNYCFHGEIEDLHIFNKPNIPLMIIVFSF